LLVSKKLQTDRPSASRYVLILDLMERSRRPLVIGGLMRALKEGNIPNDANQIVSLKK